MKEFFVELMTKWAEFGFGQFLISTFVGLFSVIIMILKLQKQIKKDFPDREIVESDKNHYLYRMVFAPFLLVPVSIFSYPLFKLFAEPNKMVLQIFQLTPFLYLLLEFFHFKKNLIFKDTGQKVFK